MNLSAHIIDTSGKLVTFLLRDEDSGKEIMRNYNKGNVAQLRQVIQSSQKYLLYLEYGTRAAEEYNARKKAMLESSARVVEELEGSEE